ncbi:MAG: sulfotransferase [Planctomycetota bacterium]
MTQHPVIVIGAHRSGTSAVARVLGRLGVFMGSRLDPNHEALFFQRLDEWILAQCGARWDNPEAVQHLIADAHQTALCTHHLAQVVRSPRAIGFLGLGRWVRGERIGSGARWGFKDPRATFTLPLWLKLFPDARVVHVHRHGVDVAQSLCKRHLRSLRESERRYRRNRLLLSCFAKRAGFGDSPRLSSLEGAFSLWESYVRRSRAQVASLGDQALEFAYEELAASPIAVVERLARFTRLDVGADAIEAAAATIEGDRAAAHRNDPSLTGFADRMAQRVRIAREGCPDAEPAIDAMAT